MRRLFAIIVSLFMLSVCAAMAAPEKEQNNEQQTEQKTEKKDDDKDKKKPRKPIQIVVYEFAWSWVTR